MTFTGDGDSSVFSSMVSQVPGWEHAIFKIECSKHTVKCYGGALEKLVAEEPGYRGRGKLMLAMRIHLTNAARCTSKCRARSVACFAIAVVRSAQVQPTLDTAEAGISGIVESEGSVMVPLSVDVCFVL